MEKLGWGGFGSVYKATKDGKICAVKVIHRGVEKQKEVLQASNDPTFKALLLAELSHPNIVKAFEPIEISNQECAFAMEFCSETLEDFIGNLGSLSRSKLFSAVESKMYQLAKAVEYIHSKGIVHRDIKVGYVIL